MPTLRPSPPAVLAALVLAAGHAPAAAQRLPPPRAELASPAPAWPGRAPLAAAGAAPPDSGQARPAYAGMVAGGLLGGALAGGAVYLLAQGSGNSLGADVVTGMVGGSVAIPLGVHLGNRGRGSLGPTVLAGLGAGLGSVLLAGLEAGSAEWYLLGAPVAALGAAVFVEGRTTPRTAGPAAP
ncbi:MAG TPA: hypothetical protein VF615_30595 [Longimicrobiaceae bacterium]